MISYIVARNKRKCSNLKLAWRLVLGNVNNHSYTFDFLDVMEFAVMFDLHGGYTGMMLRYKNSLFINPNIQHLD